LYTIGGVVAFLQMGIKNRKAAKIDDDTPSNSWLRTSQTPHHQ
jgi:hypothetical protein